jgi:hypothetical protein
MVRPGDYWVIAHPYQERPARADQFQVLHVVAGHIGEAFAIADGSFADQRPLNRFRIVGSSLYEMTTSPSGMRIVRFDLGGDA